jgi:hypothetical protein
MVNEIVDSFLKASPTVVELRSKTRPVRELIGDRVYDDGKRLQKIPPGACAPARYLSCVSQQSAGTIITGDTWLDTYPLKEFRCTSLEQ